MHKKLALVLLGTSLLWAFHCCAGMMYESQLDACFYISQEPQSLGSDPTQIDYLYWTSKVTVRLNTTNKIATFLGICYDIHCYGMDNCRDSFITNKPLWCSTTGGMVYTSYETAHKRVVFLTFSTTLTVVILMGFVYIFSP